MQNIKNKTAAQSGCAMMIKAAATPSAALMKLAIV